MFGKIAAFELRYQLKSPVLWIVFLMFFLLTFFAVVSDNVSIGGAGGNVHENSPFSIIMSTVNMSIFAQFAVVAFVAESCCAMWRPALARSSNPRASASSTICSDASSAHLSPA